MFINAILSHFINAESSWNEYDHGIWESIVGSIIYSIKSKKESGNRRMHLKFWN